MYHVPLPSPGAKLILESGAGENVFFKYLKVEKKFKIFEIVPFFIRITILQIFQKLEVVVPDTKKLPTLKEDKFMLEFYNALPEKQMIALYARLVYFVVYFNTNWTKSSGMLEIKQKN